MKWAFDGTCLAAAAAAAVSLQPAAPGGAVAVHACCTPWLHALLAALKACFAPTMHNNTYILHPHGLLQANYCCLA